MIYILLMFLIRVFLALQPSNWFVRFFSHVLVSQHFDSKQLRQNQVVSSVKYTVHL